LLLFVKTSRRKSMSNSLTRREFLGTLAAASMFPLEEEQAELILHNANDGTVN